MYLICSSKPAGVLHDVAQRDRLAVAVGHVEIDVFVDVGIQIELALLDELHHRRPRDKFRHRTRAEQREFRIDRFLRGDIGVAEAALGQDLSVLDDGDHGACEIAHAEREWHVAVEPGVDVVFGELLGLRRIGGHGRRRARGLLLRRGRRCRRHGALRGRQQRDRYAENDDEELFSEHGITSYRLNSRPSFLRKRECCGFSFQPNRKAKALDSRFRGNDGRVGRWRYV